MKRRDIVQVRRATLAAGLLAIGLLALPVGAAEVDVACAAAGDLQMAIDDADPGDVLNVSGTCLGPVTIDKDLELIGGGTPTTTIDATGSAESAVTIADGSAVIIRSLTITGGDSAAGGGIDVFGALVIDDVVVDGNEAAFGGGIHLQGTGSLTAAASYVINNVATNSGGGIYGDFGATASLTDTVISANLAENFEGGGIYQSDETFTVSGGAVEQNESFEDGGGFWVGEDGVLAVTGTSIANNLTIDGNFADGGGIYAIDATVTLTDVDLSDNTAYELGGGLFAEGGATTLAGVTVSGNTTLDEDGGGIFVRAGSLWVAYSTISDNTADIDGGGIVLDGGPDPLDPAASGVISDSVIFGNKSSGDGGGIWSTNADLTITDSTISGNTAGGGGGLSSLIGLAALDRVIISGNTTNGGDGAGLLIDATQLTMTDSTVDANDAAGGSGGGWFITGADTVARIDRSTITNNAAGNGGGFDIQSDNVTLVNSTVSGNVADSEGGGIQTENAGPTILSTTITDNTADQGGGFWQTGGKTATIRESILAGNQAPTGPDCYSMAMGDVLRSDGYTLVGSTAGCMFDDDTSDLVAIDPILAPLADNGGYTMTHDPMVGSPAIDAVPSAVCSEPTDQRLVDRPVAAGCDIGAVEYTTAAVSLCGFSDIAGNTFEDDICWLYQHDITRGCTVQPKQYCPDSTVTRGQMASFLAAALDLTDGLGADLFTDDDGSVHEDNIDLIATASITVGCSAADSALYCPLEPVTRGQMATFLARALALSDGLGADLFADDDGSVHEANIDLIATARITLGCDVSDPSRYCPVDPVTRGQMAAFIRRAMTGGA